MLLADPAAIGRFAEHRVVLPVVVITELEAKRHHPELGFFARQALRHLDDLRITHGRLDADLPVGDLGGSIRVELNHSDSSVLPAGFRAQAITFASGARLAPSIASTCLRKARSSITAEVKLERSRTSPTLSDSVASTRSSAIWSQTLRAT